MVLAPPLVISENEVDEIVVKLKSAIDRTAKDCGKVCESRITIRKCVFANVSRDIENCCVKKPYFRD